MNMLLFMTVIVSIFIRIIKIKIGNVAYVLLLFPVLLTTLIKIISNKKRQVIINKIDFFVYIFFILMLFNLFIASLRGSLPSQFILILYVIIPIIIYIYVRKINYSISSFTRLMFTFTFLYSSYEIVEFILYYSFPALKDFVTLYLKNVVATTNIYAQGIRYPFLGYYSKPWGPLLDGSGSGAFLVVLFAFTYDSKNYIQKKYFYFILWITILAIFLSGSKSAYLMLIIFLWFRYTILSDRKLTRQAIFINLIVLMLFVSAMLFYFTFYFSNDLLQFYIKAMFFDPIIKFLNGLYENGIYSFLGSGQDNAHYKILGMGEVDFFNSIIRYGMLNMFIFDMLLFYLIMKSKKKYKQFSNMYIVFFMSMIHYQVILKFPASLILFISIAVYTNEREQQKI